MPDERIKRFPDQPLQLLSGYFDPDNFPDHLRDVTDVRALIRAYWDKRTSSTADEMVPLKDGQSLNIPGSVHPDLVAFELVVLDGSFGFNPPEKEFECEYAIFREPAPGFWSYVPSSADRHEYPGVPVARDYGPGPSKAETNLYEASVNYRTVKPSDQAGSPDLRWRVSYTLAKILVWVAGLNVEHLLKVTLMVDSDNVLSEANEATPFPRMSNNFAEFTLRVTAESGPPDPSGY